MSRDMTDGPASPERDRDQALAAALRRYDRDRFLATLFAPSDARPGLWALLAFNLEIARTREAVSQPLLGQIRLQWWREALDEAFGAGPVRRHDVALALAETVRRYQPPRVLLDAMIDGRARDLDDAPFATLDELEAYAEATSGNLDLALLAVLGVSNPATLDAARHAGIAWALIGLVRAVPAQARLGRTAIPAAIGDPSGRPGPDLNAAASAILDAARRHLDAARATRSPRRALPVLLKSRIAAVYLRRLAAAGFDPYAGSVQEPDERAVWRLAWGYARGRC